MDFIKDFIDKNKKLSITIMLAVTTLFYTILVAAIDRKPIGPEGSKVGWSHLNGSFRDAIGENVFFDKFTDFLMILAILTAISFVAIGVIQLIQCKKIFKVDKTIWAMAGLYVLMVIVYIVFDKIIKVNMRPIIEEGGKLECSYPSSHVFVICTIMGSAYVAWGKIRFFTERKMVLEIARIAAIAIIALAIAGRLVAGVHWFTDIWGGVLFAATLVSAYITAIPMINFKGKSKPRPAGRNDDYLYKN